MTCHLSTRHGVLCRPAARYPARSGDLRDVTCARCLNRFDLDVDEEWETYYQGRRAAQAADAAETLGASLLWSLVQHGDSITDRLVRDILGSVLICLAEQHREQVAA